MHQIRWNISGKKHAFYKYRELSSAGIKRKHLTERYFWNGTESKAGYAKERSYSINLQHTQKGFLRKTKRERHLRQQKYGKYSNHYFLTWWWNLRKKEQAIADLECLLSSWATSLFSQKTVILLTALMTIQLAAHAIGSVTWPDFCICTAFQLVFRKLNERP